MPRAPSSTSAYGAAGPARSTPAAEIRLHFLSRLGRQLREPRDSTAPTVSADAACTGHMVFARNVPWPKRWGIVPGRARLSKLFQVPRSRDVLCVFSHHPKHQQVALRIPAGCDLHVSRRIGTRPSLQGRSILHGRYLRCYYQTILFLFSLLEPPIFYCVDTPLLFDQGAVSTKHDIGSDRARLLRLPRSHISPISSPHLAVLTIRLWRETSCVGGESTRHKLPQRSLWTGDGKTDKVSAESTPSQTD